MRGSTKKSSRTDLWRELSVSGTCALSLSLSPRRQERRGCGAAHGARRGQLSGGVQKSGSIYESEERERRVACLATTEVQRRACAKSECMNCSGLLCVRFSFIRCVCSSCTSQARAPQHARAHVTQSSSPTYRVSQHGKSPLSSRAEEKKASHGLARLPVCAHPRSHKQTDKSHAARPKANSPSISS